MSKGRVKGSRNKTTLWALESLKKRGVDYEKMLADALKAANAGDQFSLELLDRLIKLAPYIANKPKEIVGMEGIEGLVINRYKEPEKKPEA